MGNADRSRKRGYLFDGIWGETEGGGSLKFAGSDPGLGEANGEQGGKARAWAAWYGISSGCAACVVSLG